MERNPKRVLYGKGSDITNAKAVQRRARCKMITQTLMLQLIDVAKEKGANDRVKAYWNTYHCQNLIYTSEGKMYAPQCKNRFCTYCCGVRKAEMIKKYLPVLQGWDEPYFVTLTIRSPKAKGLPGMIQKMKENFKLITAKYRKRGQRQTGEKLMGLRTLECCFNPTARTYNPHLHIIVPSKKIAETLVYEWVNIWTSKFASEEAQDFRKVKDREKSLIEVIKYETKVATEPDGKKSRGRKGTAKIYVRALDNIIAATKGGHIIDRFGFNPPKAAQKKKIECRITDDYMKWEYDLKNRDWLNDEHESTLTAFEPDHELESLLEFRMNTTLE